MKTFKQFLEEAKTISYAGHDYYGSPAKKVLARRSPSSAGGDAGGGGDGGGGGGGSLEEGNPLSQDFRHRNKGIHKIIISASRKELGPKENKERMKSLYKDLSDSGATFKKTKGVWQNSAGEVEHEDSVTAHFKDDKDGSRILKLGHELRQKHDQDAFIHRKPDGSGTAHNRNGSTDLYGSRTASNVDNPYGETQFKPTKPAGKRPKITFASDDEPKSKKGSFKSFVKKQK